MAIVPNVRIKYLGHATFLMTTPGGKKLLIDPWVQNNPACPKEDKEIDSLDTVLITHAHFDHIQDVVEIAKAHEPQIGCIYEISNWLERKGVQNLNAMNKGGSQRRLGGLRGLQRRRRPHRDCVR